MDLDRLREVVMVVEFAQQHYQREPFFNPALAADGMTVLLHANLSIPTNMNVCTCLHLACKPVNPYKYEGLYMSSSCMQTYQSLQI